MYGVAAYYGKAEPFQDPAELGKRDTRQGPWDPAGSAWYSQLNKTLPLLSSLLGKEEAVLSPLPTRECRHKASCCKCSKGLVVTPVVWPLFWQLFILQSCLKLVKKKKKGQIWSNGETFLQSFYRLLQRGFLKHYPLKTYGSWKKFFQPSKTTSKSIPVHSSAHSLLDWTTSSPVHCKVR